MDVCELSEEIDVCRRLACKCRGECKEKPEIYYTPGCTVLKCSCIKIVAPEWNPRYLLDVWNDAWLQHRQNFNQSLLDRNLLKKPLYHE